jgi:TolB-like protein
MPLVPGSLVNQRYEIRALVGPDGPMEVYRALDLRMGREVALAILDFFEMHDPANLLRFESATQARGRIRHPNLTVLHDFGHEGSKVFIVAEWMAGESLRRRLSRSAMEWPEVRTVALGLVKALSALQEQGIEAKDLDLSGIHLEPDGSSRLLAYWVEPSSEATDAGAPTRGMVRLILDMVQERRKSVPPEVMARLEEWHRGPVTPGIADLEALLAPPEQPRHILPWILGGLAAVALLSVGILLSEREVRISPVLKSVAVVPLVNETPTSENTYLAPGLTDLLAQSLGRAPEIRVVPWSQTTEGRNHDPDPATAARKLGAEFGLGGRFRQSEGRLRVTLELVRAQDGALLWQEQFDRPLTELLPLAADLSGRAFDILAPGASPRSARALPYPGTHDPDAYRLYLQGRHSLTLRDPQAFQRAQTAFQGAIARDPAFAKAYSGLADTYNLMAVWGGISPVEAGAKATATSRKALELAPDLSEAHASLAYAQFRYLWDWQGAEEEFRQALRLDPANAQGHHWFAYYLSLMGRWDESLEHFQRALDLDPLNLPARVNFAVALSWAGREADSLREFDRILDQDSDYRSGSSRCLDTLEQMGRIPEVLKLWERMEQKGWVPADDVRFLRNAFESQGTTGYLAERIRQMEKTGAHSVALAEMVARVGDTERVFRLLDRAVREQSAFAVWIPKDPAFVHLRKDPRYRELLARIHFPGR